LRELGGPAAVTAFWRALGDDVSRLDRPEPMVNDVGPGEVRDTTTPRAMRHTFSQLAFGDVLSPSSRTQWLQWLTATQTGSARLPAGLPPHWRLAHKTGSGPHGETNDVGVAWSPKGHPVLLVVYYAGSEAPLAAREDVVASVARLACKSGG
jgi:beta-lactamase class A